jgi:hypothetical protein
LISAGPILTRRDWSNQKQYHYGTLLWTSVKNAGHYLIEIYDGATASGTLVHSAEVPVTENNQVSFSYVLPAGDTQFSARIKAVSALQGVEESKWSVIAFKTDPENLFQGYDTYMSTMNGCIVQLETGPLPHHYYL